MLHVFVETVQGSQANFIRRGKKGAKGIIRFQGRLVTIPDAPLPTSFSVVIQISR